MELVNYKKVFESVEALAEDLGRIIELAGFKREKIDPTNHFDKLTAAKNTESYAAYYGNHLRIAIEVKKATAIVHFIASYDNDSLKIGFSKEEFSTSFQEKKILLELAILHMYRYGKYDND